MFACLTYFLCLIHFFGGSRFARFDIDKMGHSANQEAHFLLRTKTLFITFLWFLMVYKISKHTMSLFTLKNDNDIVDRNIEKVVLDDKDQSCLDASTHIAPSSFQERRSEVGVEVQEDAQNLNKNCTTFNNDTSLLVIKITESECRASIQPPLKEDLVTVVRSKRRYQRRNSFVARRSVESMNNFEH